MIIMTIMITIITIIIIIIDLHGAHMRRRDWRISFGFLATLNRSVNFRFCWPPRLSSFPLFIIMMRRRMLMGIRMMIDHHDHDLDYDHDHDDDNIDFADPRAYLFLPWWWFELTLHLFGQHLYCPFLHFWHFHPPQHNHRHHHHDSEKRRPVDGKVAKKWRRRNLASMLRLFPFEPFLPQLPRFRNRHLSHPSLVIHSPDWSLSNPCILAINVIEGLACSM